MARRPRGSVSDRPDRRTGPWSAYTGTVPPLGVVSMSSAAISSAAVCGRSAGCFSRHRMTTLASAGGRPGRWVVTGSGSAARCAPSIAWGERPVNGGWPVSISYAMMPNA